MANLLTYGSLQYKGILNLDSTINTPLDTTLRAVTDGMGNASPLYLSTTQVSIQSASPTATGVLQLKQNSTNDWVGLTFYGQSAGNNRNWQIAANYNSQGNLDFLYSSSNSGAPTAYTAMSLTRNGDLSVGTTSASARLHVRGDGTNSIARFENEIGRAHV